MIFANKTGTLNRKRMILRDQSSFRIGGITNNFYEPKNIPELQKIVQNCSRLELKPILIGYGSNTLFPDVVDKNKCFISTKNMCGFSLSQNCQSEIIDTSCLHILSGTPLSLLAIIGKIVDINYDFTYLLPGSIGAATYINARYMDKEMSEIISSVDYIDLNQPEQGIKRLEAEKCGFGYKRSVFQSGNKFIVSVRIDLKDNQRLCRENIDSLESVFYRLDPIKEQLSDITFFSSFFREIKHNTLSDHETLPFRNIENHRDKHHHFDYPSAGSVFQNSRELGKPIGKIIEELGLKGKQVGDAQISPFHGNIIINLGSAKSAEVLKLIDIMTREILGVYCLEPKLEIKIV